MSFRLSSQLYDIYAGEVAGMIYEKRITDTAELLQGLSELGKQVGADEVVWFRGHASSTYSLLPSIARNPNGIARESMLSKRFKQNAHPFRHMPPTSEWEWLFLMQHFGVPTRLLDWTESPLTALYFTVFDDSGKDNHDGHLWALVPTKFNHDVPRIRPQVPIDIPCFGVDAILDTYRPDQMSLDPMTNLLPVAALAHRQNERIMAQMGVFTIMHRDTTPLERLADAHLARFIIPAAAKPTIKAELFNLRVTKLMLFPELASVALLAKEVLK